jgi:hypothetical protein
MQTKQIAHVASPHRHQFNAHETSQNLFLTFDLKRPSSCVEASCVSFTPSTVIEGMHARPSSSVAVAWGGDLTSTCNAGTGFAA